MGIYIITAVLLVICLVLSWFVGSMLHLQGTSLWLFRGSLDLICIAGAALFLWFHHKIKDEGQTSDADPSMGSEMDILLREADRKLRSSAAARTGINSLPLIFILGEPASAKTSVMLYSGLEPELLAGHLYDGAEVAPTRTLNIWFARKTVFIEVAGALVSDGAAWVRLLRKTSPSRVKSAFGRGQIPSRAVVVCFASDRFSAGSDGVTVSARKLGARLREMASAQGADFPVYALFTRLDRVPHFTEYVSNLTTEESGEVFGVTLPRRSGSQGLFSEEESNRINSTFDQLVYSLAEKRLDFLRREAAIERLPGIYEFPRELRKLRNLISIFLLELAKPTQLGANCFLRGFYFCGVRPVMISEAVAAAAPAATVAQAAGATRMFRPADFQTQPQRGSVMQSRRVPEWTFLSHVFNQVILRDTAAMGTSSQSAHVHTTRRILLATAGLGCLFLLIALTISFFNNHELQQSLIKPGEALSRSVPTSTDSASLDQLQQLDALRTGLMTVRSYNQEGAPLSYRWGLYSGARIYPDARAAYFRCFQRLLLSSAQTNMVASLRQLPASHSVADFQQMYATLKTYLITTAHPEKAGWDGFVQALLDRSRAFRRADSVTQDLIRKEVAFYGSELQIGNPYPESADAAAVESGRSYLRQFGVEGIYQAMLDDAGRGKPSINFNRMFPGSGQVVVDGYEVPGSFTKDGFPVMQKSLLNPDKFSGEEWVTGPQGTLNIPLDSLKSQLSERYYNDYTTQWRMFLKNARVVQYGNLRDASAKLSRLVANDSPLLGLFWLAKENTAVDSAQIRDVFDSVQSLAKDTSLQKFVGSGNQAYMGTLSQLQSVLATVSSSPVPDPAALSQGAQAAATARGAVTQIAQTFKIDNNGRIDTTVKQLLDAPIISTEQSLRAAGGAPAEAVCGVVNNVTSKYPFNSRSSQRATLQEVQDLFRPQTGTLWMLYDQRLKSVLMRQGTQFVPSGGVSMPARFVSFMEKAAQFTDTLFPNGSQTIHATFALRQLPSAGIDQSTIVIDGQTLSGAARQQLVWSPSDASSVSLTSSSGSVALPPLTTQGPWALVDFLASADWTGNNPATLEWPLQLQFGHRDVSQTSRTAVRYELETQGAQVFRKEFLEGLHCSAR